MKFSKNMRFCGFSSPCLGIFFLLVGPTSARTDKEPKHSFRPHVWGSFFYPMSFGDRFTITDGFRPHVWGSFFYTVAGKAHGVGFRAAVCGGDGSWDDFGSLSYGKSPHFPSIGGYRRGFVFLRLFLFYIVAQGDENV